MANRLIHETSPYLLQHAHNPVDWYAWGEEALARARAEDRPILLSIGYSACHWCHVMERESFENPGTAELMNASFVNIKVDREERPDLDGIYMQAVQAMTGQGGWPMTVFLMPDGQPFYGGTYFPPRSAHGRAGFVDLLEAVDDAWKNRRNELQEHAGELSEAIRAHTRIAPPSGQADVGPALLEGAYSLLRSAFDREWGGFGSAPKFPQTTFTELLMRAYSHNGSPDTLEMITTTLDAMASGGIYDH